MPNIEISAELIQTICLLPLFILSITVHEYAHGRVAFYFGDDTAKVNGRLTLNPLKHIDLFGTILMPLISLTTGIPLIGWAKPVPVNPGKFRNPIKNDLVVSAAGPLSNLAIAVFLSLLVSSLINNLHFSSTSIIREVFKNSIFLNIFLCMFNLLPIPPLDGSHILFDLFPNKITARYMSLGMYGSIILIVILNTPLFSFFIRAVKFATILLLKISGTGN